MICLLCISESDQMLNIFDQNGINLNIRDIITKYFWLQPNAENINARSICCSCWITVETFHTYYTSIEKAHNRLICLKQDKDESTHFHNSSDLSTTVVKQEDSDEKESNLPEILEINPLIQPKNDEENDSESESEVPLAMLSDCQKVTKNDKYEETSGNESNSDITSIGQHNATCSESESEYTAPKKKAKVKATPTVKDHSKNSVHRKEFDSFIKTKIDISCNVCTKPLSNFFSLKEHCKKVHKTDGFVICCDRQWTSRFSLVHHLLLHQNPDRFKCEECDRVLANKKSFNNHMKTHLTQKQEPIHKCVKCNKLFSSIAKLERHLNIHVQAIDTDQICEQCGKVYHSRQVLVAHQKREHMGIVKKSERVQCPKCGVYLGDLSTLKFHTKHLHPKIKVVHACTICGRVSATAYGLKRHIQYMHTMKRIHKCTICKDKAFKTAQILRPSAEDNNTKAICSSCWKTLESFHRFYETIEEAHTKLTTCLKLPIEENDPELNHHFEVLSDFFTPVVKQETNVELPDTIETPSIQPIDTLAKNDETLKALNSDSESEVPLVELSNQAKSIKDDNDEEENSGNESDSAQDNGYYQQDDDSGSSSDSDSEYKKKGNWKVLEKTDRSKKKQMPCKEFDSFIKQNMELVCNICNEPVDNFSCLKEHFKEAHKLNAFVICCEKQWTSRFSLVHHLLLHKNPDLYKCQKCGRVLANKKSFKNHTQSHITQERIHKCPKCVKMFSSIAKLEKHSKTHIKPRIDQICEQCGKVCHSKQSLIAHQKREHLGFVKQRVQCPTCGTYLSDSSTLHTHMKYQHPKVEVLNVCKLCGKISSTGYGLKRHMQYMHLMERVHKCNICEDKAFKTAQRLRPDAKDPSAKFICTTCWAELSTFHEFYVQVEEAHVSQRRVIENDEELKLENVFTQSTQENPLPGEQFASEFLDSDIKLEVKEDADVRLNAGDDHTAEYSKSQTPSQESQSVNLEAPPASSTRSRRSVDKPYVKNDSSTSEDEKNFENNYVDRCNSTDWQNEEDNSDNTEEDSDYEDRTSKSKKSNEPTAKKRGRPRKGEARAPPCKKRRNSGEQNLKRKRMQEFDEIIAQNMKLSCAMCQNIFANFAALKRHFRSEHNECGYVVCCTKKFRKRGVLVDHICTHQNPEYFKCEQCGRVLANRKGLDSHMLTHDTEKQRIYQCDQCTLSFYTRPLLTRHLQTHISERNIKCPDCDKFFSTQDILRTHVNNVHNAAYTRICDQCGKSFRRPDAFRRHQLEHDGITQPMVPCEKCNVKLTSKYGLKRHMESMHPEQDVKHICTECGKVAPSAAALQRHISYMHKMERKYKCPMCDKAFKKTGGLKPNQNDENSRYICGSCWNALYSFHKFYKQVEEAHLSLLTATAIPEEDLKPEDDEIAVEVEVRLIDKFDSNGDYSNTDVKLEVKEDGEICLPQIEHSSEIDLKLDDHEIEQKQQHSLIDSSDSDDSEVPLANFSKTHSKIKRRTKVKTTTSSNDDQESSAEWQDPNISHDDDDDDEEDSDFEEKHKPTPIHKVQSGKKRGRPLKGTSRNATRKEITEEQVKKQQLSHEYDDIIQKHMKLTCNICQLALTNFFSLKKHYRCKHNERGYAFCCSKKFLKRGVLVDHIYTHLNPEHFKCDKCDKVLADRRCLEVHMNIHSEEKQRIYQCDQCNKSFFKKPLLTRHMHIHIPQEERKFHCEECNKFFPSNYTLRAHINNVHQNAYAKFCDQCGKSIRGREAFQRHLLEHAGVPIPSVQCEKCGAKLKNKYGLKRHMNAMHADSAVPHVCNLCGKVAPNAPALQRHYYYVHKCERSHKCPMCDKAFKKAAGLKEHMTTHTGEVLYTCPHCPKTFNSNANMHSHRKKMHRKEWEENRRHPHMGASAISNNVTEENTQQQQQQ